MSDYSHHRAHAPAPAIIFVEVPAAGSPKSVRTVKPRYPNQERPEHWRPARDIPVKRGKAEALRRLLENIARQDEEIRAYMASARFAAA